MAKIKMPEKVSAVLEKLDEKHIYYIMAGVLLLVFLLDYLLIMRPQLNNLTKLVPDIKQTRSDIEKTKTDKLRLPQFKAQVEELKEDLEKINERVASKDDYELIIERLSTIASEQNVKIDGIVPNYEEQEILLDNADRVYYTVPIIINAKSGYHNLGKFINKVEQDDLSMSIASFQISKSENKKMHSVEIDVDTIIYEEK